MKKIVALLVCIGMMTGSASCAKKDKGASGNDNTGASSEASADTSEDPDTPKDYRLGEFDEALISYLCLNGYDSSDILVSPASFRASLCLAAVGAQGNTRTELLKAAGFSGMDALNTWYSTLGGQAVNSVWSNEDMLGKFSDTYASRIAEHYNADAFSRKSEELTQAINDWTAQKTDGAVSGVTDDVSGASAVMISTLNLQTAWKTAFQEASLSEEVFTGYDGKERKMNFMEQTGEFLYAEENGVQVLAVPMENNMSFVCFLGNRTGRFEKMAGIQPENVHVVLPEFELGSIFDSRDFFGFLLQQGVNDAINSQTANFYNMCSGSDWFMQETIQKLRISAGKNGIGVTSGTADTADLPGSDEAKEFIANEPFAFAVFSDFGTDKQHMLLYGQMMNGG